MQILYSLKQILFLEPSKDFSTSSCMNGCIWILRHHSFYIQEIHDWIMISSRWFEPSLFSILVVQLLSTINLTDVKITSTYHLAWPNKSVKIYSKSQKIKGMGWKWRFYMVNQNLSIMGQQFRKFSSLAWSQTLNFSKQSIQSENSKVISL